MRRILTAMAMVVALLVVFAAAPADAQSCPGRPTVSPPCGPPGNPPPNVGGEGETPPPPPETPPANPPQQPPTVEPDTATPPVIGGNPATPTNPVVPTKNPTVLESVVRLPLTGTEIGPVGVLGLVLTAGGVVFAVAGRRRRTSLDAAV